ncbi:YchJ family protein [Microbacterium sp.]|uniref:YchJ family protein n=1 Tax=Microbacterium sp. TaxID=51671 RepID=UPI003A8C6435
MRRSVTPIILARTHARTHARPSERRLQHNGAVSFGSAAARRGRRPRADAPCPCGSGGTVGSCCGPVLDGTPAATAEQLMRSRFTAFALGDRTHLEATWHPATRPDVVQLDPDLRWRRLTIHGGHGGGPGDPDARVVFTADWVHCVTGRTGALHEDSRFVRRAGRWWYVEAAADRSAGTSR